MRKAFAGRQAHKAELVRTHAFDCEAMQAAQRQFQRDSMHAQHRTRTPTEGTAKPCLRTRPSAAPRPPPPAALPAPLAILSANESWGQSRLLLAARAALLRAADSSHSATSTRARAVLSTESKCLSPLRLPLRIGMQPANSVRGHYERGSPSLS